MCKLYGVYFDKCRLEVYPDGCLENYEVLQIIEFEYVNEDSDEIIAIRRVNEDGEVLEDPWKELAYKDALDHVGDDDNLSIETALGWFDKWLEEHTEWRCSYQGTYWQPPEYICIGISGCVE